MSKSITAVSGAGRPPDDRRPDHGAAAALDRLGARTNRRRARGDKRVTVAFHCLAEAWDELSEAQAKAHLARGLEAAALAVAASSHDTAHPEDRGRRGLSNLAYGLMLVVFWLLNLPIAVATFQVFGEPGNPYSFMKRLLCLQRVDQLVGVVTTIQDTPKRSATMPKRGEKKVFPIGICTCPPSARAANSRSASAASAAVSESEKP